jgi:nucleotide-binding universal stress UspA family protein
VVEFKRILCPVDLSDMSVRALAYADTVARWYGGHVTALYVAPPMIPVAVPAAGYYYDPVPAIPPVPREELMRQLHVKVSAAGMKPAHVTAIVEDGEAVPVIIDQAKKMSADLIVMGTHGLSGFDRFLLGSVTEKVLHKAACPVLTVPPHAHAKPPAPPEFDRILCAIDFSRAAIDSLRYAVDIGRRAGASVLAINAIESLAEEDPRENAHYNVAEFRQYLIDDASEQLVELVSKEAVKSGEIETVVEAGRAYREILRVADEQHVDLIVMGTQGRGGAALALFGSTTQQVVRGALCPVLTVR